MRLVETPWQVLIADDDREPHDLLAMFLQRDGYRSTAVASRPEAKRAWLQTRFDVVLLDLMLPSESGLESATWLRQRSEVPLIRVTAKCNEADRVIGLELGADDYIGKPFNPRELLARIRVILRRASARTERFRGVLAQALCLSGWRLEQGSQRLLNPEGMEVALTGGEYDLLLMLAQRPNRVLTRDLLRNLWRGGRAGSLDRSIDVAISRLRHKLRDSGDFAQLIKTVRSGGYVLAGTVERE